MSARVPGQGRYARPEREQRWLLDDVPAGATGPVEITDLYIMGTRLRLRRMEWDGDVVFKLAQKVRPVETSPAVVMLTNVYLARGEYETLAALGGAEIRKTRWRAALGGREVAVDRFAGRLLGLVLAEVELAPEEAPLAGLALPVAVDVSDDDRFSGGRLAQSSDDEVGLLLEEARRLTGWRG